MFDFSAVDVSAVVGLTAMVLLTLNILMGLLVSVNYNFRKQWPHRKLPVPLFRIHNWTGYAALSVAALHPTILLFASTKEKFHPGDLLLPLHSPYQTVYNSLGAIGFYSFALVVVTSYFRPKLGSRPWKKLHYTAYFAAAIMFIHGTLIDQNLKNETPDFLDGEKVLVEVCFLIVAAASIWRWKYGKEKQRYHVKREREMVEV
ncbi:MAG TPA: ferric reductase-like transmembrane domain-containing protein [Candidatus Sulfopaludibacter sp.]|nr:ferric reductase-like transmembrane domain-containing protein [Candidatus Sulfopaludibacter sp.]